MANPWSVLLTCEHAGNIIPAAYRALFRHHHRLLESHRGWDPGALAIARAIEKQLDVPLMMSTVSRLVVDLNRAPTSPTLLSKFTTSLSDQEKETLLERYYRPHHLRIHRWVTHKINRGARVLHIAVHSFTPVFKGVRRTTDIGLLYDTTRAPELKIAGVWEHKLRVLGPRLHIHHNQPYSGKDDGLPTHLRQLHAGQCYAGFEIEVNQRFARSGAQKLQRITDIITASVEQTLAALT